MKTLKTIVSVALLISLAFVLSGCSLLSSCAAESTAALASEQWAKDYIQGKYGIAAETLGHKVQYSGSLVQEARTTVIVPMRYEDTEFCVYLDTADASCRYDNYQRDVVSSVLEDYLLSTCNLPKSSYSTLDFNMGKDRAFVGRHTDIVEMGWSENTTHMYDSSRMLNFKYDGQSPEELLDKITTIDYTAAFSDTDKTLGTMTPPYDIAVAHSAEISMSLWNYMDPAALEVYVTNDDLYGFHCYDLDPTSLDYRISHGADEVRYYMISWWNAENNNGEPEIVDSYADCAEMKKLHY